MCVNYYYGFPMVIRVILYVYYRINLSLKCIYNYTNGLYLRDCEIGKEILCV